MDGLRGKVLNGMYRIEERLAAGGFGEVLPATQLHGDELAQVVLKFLHRELPARPGVAPAARDRSQDRAGAAVRPAVHGRGRSF